MIARIIIPIIIIILLSDIYVDRHFLSKAKNFRRAKRAAWLLQCVISLAYSIFLASSKSFAPEDINILNYYLLMLGIWILPKFVFALCSILGWGHCEYHHTKTNWGNTAGTVFGALIVATTIYGYTLGFSELETRRITFVSKDLPEEFDGYKIVQFSDAHVGTFSTDKAYILSNAIDSMNKERPDLIVFTGDLQNMQPSEIRQHESILKRLHGKDGTISILGNHDYSYYLDTDEKTKEKNNSETKSIQKEMGWTLLCNESRTIYRGNDSIVVAGMEYEGKSKKVPNRGDLKKTLKGIDQEKSFIIMLQHDPTSWETEILPQSKAQLTLSGHTHAGQMKIFGWSPVSLIYKEWGGIYYSGKRAINVSTGIGGFVPFRFNCPGEIVVITLKKEQKQCK